MRFLQSSLLLCLSVVTVLAAPNATLGNATVTGLQNGTLDKFLGIPFANPPVGDLRFRLPVNISSYNQSFDATQYGFTCVAQNSTASSNLVKTAGKIIGYLFGDDDEPKTPQSEDCLTLNVVRPSNATSNSSLPVLWIYGGGFQGGSTISYDNMSTTVVQRSMEVGKPVIFVSMNYRATAFGFIASQEVKQAGVGNIGLYDQRAALGWVKKYIGSFGGNSSRIILWGESAGAISASLQMLAYDGNAGDLFHGAFMQSGAPIPVGDMSLGQPWYDQLVQNANCTGQNDTLSCLRSTSLDTLTSAIQQSPGLWSYQSLVLAWMPRADGVFLTDHPQKLVSADKVARIPMVSGNCDDEGTLFSQSSTNVTNDGEFHTYIQTLWLPNATDAQLSPLYDAYPSDPSDGSPFNTSIASAITGQYKRIAAFQGDAVFQAPRRYFMRQRAGKQPMWGFVSKRLKFVPILGSFHGSDLYLDLMNDYVIYFANNLDPNTGSGVNWPQYTNDSLAMYTFLDRESQDIEITQDTYRQQPIQILTNLSLQYPI
ncbi:carotenoid ester lipase [Coprinellus micaceus]|uniref:Carboxylic ester hydrolase n=1 Tax=Coprinellus micaceus TaxID=71717 RepID=A0A4Y7TWK7_COPMI|nr:carotenoid ester lipase [Coprinellus micaceus]